MTALLCRHCTAPISFPDDAPVVCTFCKVTNAPPAREVPVPVPVQIVHNVVHVTRGGDARELRCPHCKKRLVGVRVEDVELNGCGGCGGIWIDNESARRVLANPRPVFEELADLAAKNARGRVVRESAPACPACDAVLDGVMVKQIPLDVCPDHGTWFDARELQRLGHALRGVPPTHARPSGPTACAECNDSIAASAANIGENGPTCEACWRRRQAQLVAVADRQHGERVNAFNAGGAALLVLGLAGALLAGAARSSDS